MVDLNLSNIITIGLISIAVYAGTKAVLKMANVPAPWL